MLNQSTVNRRRSASFKSVHGGSSKKSRRIINTVTRLSERLRTRRDSYDPEDILNRKTEYERHRQRTYSAWPHFSLIALTSLDFILYLSLFDWSQHYHPIDVVIYIAICISLILTWTSWIYSFYAGKQLRRTSIDLNTLRNRSRQVFLQSLLRNAHIVSILIVSALLIFWHSYLSDTDCSDIKALYCSSPLSNIRLPSLQSIFQLLLPLSYQILINATDTTMQRFLWITSFLSILLPLFIFQKTALDSFILLAISIHIGVIMAEIDRHSTETFQYFIDEMRLLEDVLLNKFKEEEEKNKSAELRRMIGNIAHDVKSPLSSLRLGLEGLLSSLMKKEYSLDTCGFQNSPTAYSVKEEIEICKSLESSFSFMSMTIGRAMDFQRTNKGFTLVPDLNYTNLDPIMHRVIACCRETKQNVVIAVDPLPRKLKAKFYTDESWLFDNLLCLVSNAVKYTDNDKVNVRFSLLAQPEEDRDMLHIEVEDAGPGLSAEAKVNIFNLFHDDQRKVGGSGLGLYCLSRRVKALGGACGVLDREDGQQAAGALFWFDIPFIIYRRRAHTEASHKSEYSIISAASRQQLHHQASDDSDNSINSYKTINSRRNGPAHSPQIRPKLSKIVSPRDTVHARLSGKARHLLPRTTSGKSILNLSIKGRSGKLSKSIKEPRSLSGKIMGALFPLRSPRDDDFTPIPVGEGDNPTGYNEDSQEELQGLDPEGFRLLIIGYEETVVSVLKAYGHHIDLAESGMLAYELLQKSTFDTVIITSVISYHDAIVFLQKYRYLESTREFSVKRQMISVVTDVDLPEQTKLFHGGCDFIFCIPFSVEQFQVCMALYESNDYILEAARRRQDSILSSMDEEEVEEEVQVVPSPPPEEAKTPADVSPILRTRRKLDSMQILIVDDSITILSTLARILKNAGFEVSRAENGAIAFELLKRTKFDAVLLDQQMPVMDGPECLRNLRAFEEELRVTSPSKQRHQLVVAMSANTDEECKGEAFKAGADFFVQKPFSLQRLQEILKQYYAIDSYASGEGYVEGDEVIVNRARNDSNMSSTRVLDV